MENTSYRTLYQGGIGEIIEKKSRFIASCSSAVTEEDALSFISKVKKQHYNASHNCFAYTIGKNHELKRCSDDGEPSKTAGMPMLNLLLMEEIHNIVVVVTRYFGGTLLGTGGLVRAYQKATAEGLKNSIIIERQCGVELSIQSDYQILGKVQYLIGKYQLKEIASNYTDSVLLNVIVPIERMEEFKHEVIDGTNGVAGIEEKRQVEFAMIENEIKIF